MTDEYVEDDPLQRMKVYQYARTLRESAWPDVELLTPHIGMQRVVVQLYESVGSIAANIAEGYSKSSGKDRARSFEYALGSARESKEWYEAGLPVLGKEIVNARLEVLGHIRRMLTAIIPEERGRIIKPNRTTPKKF